MKIERYKIKYKKRLYKVFVGENVMVVKDLFKSSDYSRISISTLNKLKRFIVWSGDTTNENQLLIKSQLKQWLFNKAFEEKIKE